MVIGSIYECVSLNCEDKWRKSLASFVVGSGQRYESPFLFEISEERKKLETRSSGESHRHAAMFS